jgi:hypothetical protein
MSDAVLTEAREAWTRLRNRERASWSDWLAVGRAIAIGRIEALRAAKTNKAVGSTYNKAMRSWLHENGLAGVTAQERHAVLNILEHLPAIEA